MIYQLINKTTEILAIATFHIAYLCYWCKHVFALLISTPHFNRIFHQNRPNSRYLFFKNTKFERWVLCFQTPVTAPQLRISG